MDIALERHLEERLDAFNRRLREEVSEALRAQLGTSPCANPAECKCEPCRLWMCEKSRLVFACDRWHCGGDHEVRVIRRTCDRRWCPTCRVRLRKRKQRAALAAVEHALKHHPRAQVVHAVLSQPNSKSLTRGILRKLHADVGRWMRRVRVKANVLGVWRSTEVTWSKNKGFHPHVHLVLLLAPPKVRTSQKHGLFDWGAIWRRLTMEWHSLTGCTVVCGDKAQSMEDRKPAKDHEEEAAKGCTAGGSFWMGTVHDCNADPVGAKVAASEAAKYVSKGFVEWDIKGDPYNPATPVVGLVSPVLWQLVDALGGERRGLRVTAGLGAFYRVKVAPEPTDEYVCEACAGHNVEAPPEQVVDARMKCRGSPEALRELGMAGCQESAALYDRATGASATAFPA